MCIFGGQHGHIKKIHQIDLFIFYINGKRPYYQQNYTLQGLNYIVKSVHEEGLYGRMGHGNEKHLAIKNKIMYILPGFGKYLDYLGVSNV